jgi:hypothetical protein
LVERNLAKVEVGSSSLLSRSRFRESDVRLERADSMRHARTQTSLSRFSFGDGRRRGSKAVMQRIANPSRAVRLRPAPPIFARMVKLVDTRDLKSLGWKRLCRFESGSGHQSLT